MAFVTPLSIGSKSIDKKFSKWRTCLGNEVFFDEAVAIDHIGVVSRLPLVAAAAVRRIEWCECELSAALVCRRRQWLLLFDTVETRRLRDDDANLRCCDGDSVAVKPPHSTSFSVSFLWKVNDADSLLLLLLLLVDLFAVGVVCSD